MPTIFTHAFIPIAASATAGRARIPAKLALVGAALAILPDFDVIGFRFGIDYGSQWGHRGFSHSLLAAALGAGLIALLWRGARSVVAILFLFCAMASHACLDLLTDGGQGVMIFWPVDHTRYFLPWQPIRVSPIGVRFFTGRGLETAGSELLTVWLPALLIAVAGIVLLRSEKA